MRKETNKLINIKLSPLLSKKYIVAQFSALKRIKKQQPLIGT